MTNSDLRFSDSGKLSRLNPDDEGDRYDTSGDACGKGNSLGSICLGYKHWVEPHGPRTCIKCRDDPKGCPTNKSTQDCPVVTAGVDRRYNKYLMDSSG